MRTVLEAPVEKVAGEVFNAGRSGENYRKLDLVEEIRRQTDRGEVSYVHRDEDPRDYKVSFDKIRAELGFETLMTVPDGIAEIIAALDAGALRRPLRRPLPEHPELDDDRARFPELPLFDLRWSRRTSRRSPRRCARAG